MQRNDNMKKVSRRVCSLIKKTQTILLSNISISQHGSENQHSSAIWTFPQKIILSILIVPHFFYSVDEEARQLGLVWKQCLNQSACGISPSAVPHWLASCSKCPKAKGIHLFLFSMSVQSCSKQKQQGRVLTADLSGGGGLCLLAAWCSPLTWSRLNHSRPANNMQWRTS